MSAVSMANELSQPKSLSEGRSEKTVIASPQASTMEVKINGGPIQDGRAFDRDRRVLSG